MMEIPTCMKFQGGSGRTCGLLSPIPNIRVPRSRKALSTISYPSRSEKLLIRKEHFGLLIYDRLSKQMYWTNKAGEEVMRMCDGTHSILEIAKLIKQCHGSPLDATINLIGSLSTLRMLKEGGEPSLVHIVSQPNPYCLTAPAKIYWTICKKCDSLCRHCFTSSGPSETDGLPTRVIRKTIDELANLKVFQIAIGGGEPLLREDIFDIISYACRKGIDVYLTTNGHFLDSAKTRRLKDIGVYYVQVSVDGCDSTSHGALRGNPSEFEKVISGIRMLEEQKIVVVLATTVSKVNFNGLRQIFRLALDLNVGGIRVIRLRNTGRASENTKALELTSSQYLHAFKYAWCFEKKHPEMPMSIDGFFQFLVRKKDTSFSFPPFANFGCPAGRSILSIDADGDLMPCGFLEKRFVLGNVLMHKIGKIWNSSQKADLFRHLVPKEPCASCVCLNLCQGGCRSEAFQAYGELTSPDPLCPMIKRAR